MTVKHISKSDEIRDLISNSAGKVVVVDYWAGWCGPCVGFAPTFEKMSSEFADCIFAKVEVDEVPEAADDANIESLPTIIVYLNGKRHEAVIGANEGKLRDAIKKAKSKL
jgi:thioredoxin